MTTKTISALALPLPQPEGHTLLPTAAIVSELMLPLPQPADYALLMKHGGPIAHINVFIDDFIGIAQGSWHHC